MGLAQAGGQVVFWGTGWPPAPGSVVPPPHGLFRASAEGVELLVHHTDALMGDGGERNWVIGDHMFAYDGNWLAFTALAGSGLGPGGVFLHDGESVHPIVLEGESIPGAAGEESFYWIEPFAVDGKQVALFGLGSDPSGVQGLYRYDEAGLAVIVDNRGTGPTGFGELVSLLLGSSPDPTVPHMADGTVVFAADFEEVPGAERRWALLKSAASGFELVARQGDPFPGGAPGEVFAALGRHLTTSVGAVAFVGFSDRGSWALLSDAQGQLEVVVTGQTDLPGGGGTFGVPSGISLHQGELVFASGGDIWRHGEGGLVKVIPGRAFDGAVRLLPPGSFDGRHLAFSADAIYLADLAALDPPPAGEAYTSSWFPGYRFSVRITGPEGAIPTRQEGECLAEALCVSGALPGRTELIVRLVGPRPNGRIWPVVSRLTMSQVEVWVEQLATGDTKYYLLPGATPGSSTLDGLFDRDGFVP